MSTIPTRTVKSLEYLHRLPETYTALSECTLIQDARNSITQLAIDKNFDRILWIDSDMVFDNDLLLRLSKDMDNGHEMVCGLFFKREIPTTPVIYDALTEDKSTGNITPSIFFDYPHDQLFRIAACGFGAVMTSVQLLRDVWDKFGPPFDYHANLGEDISFCWRVGQLGREIYCDSAVKVGHLGRMVYAEDMYMLNRRGAKANPATSKQAPESTSPDKHVTRTEQNDDDRTAIKTPRKLPYYETIVNSMIRYYYSHQNADLSAMSTPNRAAWTACDNVIRNLAPYQRDVSAAFFRDRDVRSARNQAARYCLNERTMWRVISDITKQVAIERGLYEESTGRIRKASFRVAKSGCDQEMTCQQSRDTTAAPEQQKENTYTTPGHQKEHTYTTSEHQKEKAHTTSEQEKTD